MVKVISMIKNFKMMKNVKDMIIAGLGTLCLLLLVILLFSSGTQTANVSFDEIPVSASGNKEKLSPQALIQMATIEGISLSTAPEEIEKIAGTAGFTCEKRDQGPGTDWVCLHGKMADTSLRITVEGDKIKNISRHGNIALGNLTPTMNMMSNLYGSVNTRKGVRFSQSEDMLSFTVRHQDEKSEMSADYNIMTQRVRDEKNPENIEKTQQIYSAAITQR